jgi:ketosteroid isomerase-like protein
VDTAAAQNSLREADAAYSRAGNSRDLEGFVAHYAPEAVGYPPNEPTVTGTDSIRAYLGRFFQDTAFAATFQPVSLEVSSDGTMGYSLNTVELRVTGPEGKPVTERIRDLHVWRKQADGSWKLVIDLWNVAP